MFKIYSSSAGSGKTYTLAREYMKLALMDSPVKGRFDRYYFKHILAVTFTNDAANEMKERILKYLHLLGQEGALAASEQGLLEQIREGINEWQGNKLDNQEVRRRAKEVFQTIIHDYSFFSVSTIDSFVQRIVGAFTEELKIPYNFEVSLDSEVLLDATTEDLLSKAGIAEYEQVTRALREFALEKVEEGQSGFNLGGEVSVFAKNLLSETHYEAIQKLRFFQPAHLLAIRKQVVAFNNEYLKKIKALGKEACDLMAAEGLDNQHFYYKDKGIAGYFEKLSNTQKPNKIEAKGYVQKTINENIWYTAKNTPMAIQKAIDGISTALSDLYVEIELLRKHSEKKYILFDTIKKSLYNLSLLSQMQETFTRIQEESGQVHISRFNRDITQIVLNEPIPFVFERMGEKYHHLLIDEFQDTSSLQWVNFLPLISNALSQDFFNMAVGDSKQAIYRWRGGELEQIVQLYQQNLGALLQKQGNNEFVKEHYLSIEPNIQPENLTTNYRSTQQIVAFNNALFRSIANSKAEEFPLLSDVYDEHFEQALPPKPKIGGHVQIDFLGKVSTEQMQEKVLALVQEAEAAGFAWKDIAILNRQNKEGKATASFLKDKGYEIISSDSLLLSFSPSVNLVLAIMKVIHNPNNSLAKYEALYLFYRLVIGQMPNNETNIQIKAVVDSPNPQAFFEFVTQVSALQIDFFSIQQVTLYEMAEQLISTFKLYDRSKDRTFLFRLLDVILEFSLKKSGHLTDFVNFWEKKKDSLSINTPHNANAISIMSIHKSKGLEFPVVIVPNCNWGLKPQSGATLWADLEALDYPELRTDVEIEDGFGTKIYARNLATAPLNIGKDLEQTAIAEQHKTETERTFIENLNMLYVAFTRPTQRLYVVIKQTKTADSVGELLRSYLKENHEAYNPETPTYVLAEGESQSNTSKKPLAERGYFLKDVISENPSKRVRLSRRAGWGFDIETFESSRDWGNQVHYALALIKTEADIQEAVYQCVREGVVAAKQANELAESITQIVQHPQLSALFSEEVRAENEKEILTPTGVFRTDRVVFWPNGRVEVLDYKTGVRKKAHAYQVKQYMNLYLQMGYSQVSGKIVYLEDLEVLSV